MPNSLKELRLKTKTPAKDMVAVVQTIYPKYDMTSQSKCENSDAYGICLTQKAMKALYAKFDPDGSIFASTSAQPISTGSRISSTQESPPMRPPSSERTLPLMATTPCRIGSQMLCADISAKEIANE